MGNQENFRRPVELLQNLIRFDTTNPPGKEGKCIAYIYDLLKEVGYRPTVLAKQANRPNLITRLKGRGEAPPLLLYGHVDVVTTAHQNWTYPPFEGREVDGYIWGRGALDMKSGVAMMLAAFLRAKAERLEPAGDILFSVMSDEEALGEFGVKFLVDEHPEQFEGVRYALSEFGGVSMYLAGKKFYPIQVAEKQICWMKMKITGPAGHGSRIVCGGAMAALGEILRKLDRAKLPIHVTDCSQMMVGSIANELPFPANMFLRLMLQPMFTRRILALLGPAGENLEPLLRNTVNATIVRGGEKVNVVPSEIELQLDGRLLPGYRPEDMMVELREAIGEEINVEVETYEPMEAEPDMGWFEFLAQILREGDPEGVPIPMLLPGVTDARYLSKLGIQTYGFTPMKLPRDFAFFDLLHGADERIPVEAVEFGTEAIYKAIQRYGKYGVKRDV
jgi:acetylornithine deacetylase/succinyl-diaminopimelate desuccinylase-like protein